MVTNEGTERFLVNCTAAGIPPPNITWSDPDGMELPNDDNMRITVQPLTTPLLMTDDGFTFLYHVTSILVITDTNDIDTGNYTCMADNDVVTMDSNIIEVFVRGKYYSLRNFDVISNYLIVSLTDICNTPVKTFLHDLTRKGPFLASLQDLARSCKIMWDLVGLCRHLGGILCKIPAKSHKIPAKPHKILQDPTGSCKILQEHFYWAYIIVF